MKLFMVPGTIPFFKQIQFLKLLIVAFCFVGLVETFATAGTHRGFAHPEIQLDLQSDLGVVSEFQRISQLEALTQPLQWRVGDLNNYSIRVQIARGTMTSKVREEVVEGYWVVQNVAVMGQYNTLDLLMSRQDGTVLKMYVNGQERTPPNSADLEILETRTENVRVPAGNYWAQYQKTRSRSNGAIYQTWLSPAQVPIHGMVKTIAPVTLGSVRTTATVELSSFTRAP